MRRLLEAGFNRDAPPVVSGRTDTRCKGDRNERRFGNPTLPTKTLRIDGARRMSLNKYPRVGESQRERDVTLTLSLSHRYLFSVS